MNLKLLIAVTTLAVMMVPPAPGAGQDLNAEVRAWNGQSWRLLRSSLEVFYTIMPVKPDQGGAQAPAPPPATGGSQQPLLFGSLGSMSQMFDKQPEPKQGHTQLSAVTLVKDGVETRIPLTSLASLVFQRQAVRESPLPPHVAPIHFRYSATAMLTDGSRVEGDYVNLGSAVLRGVSSEGRVDIPWQEIESVRFAR